jgi:hypothetical protein
LLKKLFIKPVSVLVYCFYLNLVFRLKVYKTAVFINIILLFLLYKHNIILSYALYVIYIIIIIISYTYQLNAMRNYSLLG